MDLTGKTAIVTGAAAGIGRGIVRRLTAAGATVAGLDIDGEGLHRTIADIRAHGGHAAAFPVDVTRREETAAVVAEAIAHLGRLDILVNCAGAGWRQQTAFRDSPGGSWDWILDVNVRGVLHVTHAALGRLAAGGRIINIASVAASVGIPRLAVYSASKGAVVSFTKALAMELGPEQITVNCVSPGLITDAAAAPESQGTFLGRMGTPADVAAVVAFLVSDEAAFTTGIEYLVDGGRVLGPRGA